MIAILALLGTYMVTGMAAARMVHGVTNELSENEEDRNYPWYAWPITAIFGWPIAISDAHDHSFSHTEIGKAQAALARAKAADTAAAIWAQVDQRRDARIGAMEDATGVPRSKPAPVGPGEQVVQVREFSGYRVEVGTGTKWYSQESVGIMLNRHARDSEHHQDDVDNLLQKVVALEDQLKRNTCSVCANELRHGMAAQGPMAVQGPSVVRCIDNSLSVAKFDDETIRTARGYSSNSQVQTTYLRERAKARHFLYPNADLREIRV